VDRDDAESLKNPVSRDALSVRRGELNFQDRCAACHGPQGHGGGPVSKFFPPAPDLAYITVKARSDGYLFGTITFGGRAMPPMAEGLSARDRWDLVNFVRTVQGQPLADGRR
jgi:mono/diheme cytochrome c family protein